MLEKDYPELFCLQSWIRFSRYQEVEKVRIAESNVPHQLSPADRRMRGQLRMEVFTNKNIP